ncbi:MAG: hypothetical protein LBL18_06225 [Bacteroidales bacterium]|jgi:hypothetical protein|nr:hypothetical protein [Bacteroidales bacterium]
MAQTKLKVKQIEQITSDNVNDIIANSTISAIKLTAGITDTELGYLGGVTSAIQTQLNAKLDVAKLKTDGNVTWTDDTVAATAKAIAAKIAAEIASAQIGGAMAFKGAWSTATINSSVKAGWTYVYDSGTAPTGHTLEAGDMLIAKVDNPGTTTAANWTVVQANISGAVTSIETSATDGQLALFNGTGGKQIKKSTLSGLVKLTSGVPSAATGTDLPAHGHSFRVYDGINSAALNTEETLIIFSQSRELVVVVTSATSSKGVAVGLELAISIANGAAQSGKCVTGISYDSGVFTLTFGDLPVATNKSDWKTGATPTGTLNGTNRVFTIPESIVAGTEQVIINGQIITRGVDYTISAATITLATDAYIPVSGDVIRVNYVKA